MEGRRQSSRDGSFVSIMWIQGIQLGPQTCWSPDPKDLKLPAHKPQNHDYCWHWTLTLFSNFCLYQQPKINWRSSELSQLISDPRCFLKESQIHSLVTQLWSRSVGENKCPCDQITTNVLISWSTHIIAVKNEETICGLSWHGLQYIPLPKT